LPTLPSQESLPLADLKQEYKFAIEKQNRPLAISLADSILSKLSDEEEIFEYLDRKHSLLALMGH